jgi:hypothetical protein
VIRFLGAAPRSCSDPGDRQHCARRSSGLADVASAEQAGVISANAATADSPRADPADHPGHASVDPDDVANARAVTAPFVGRLGR